MSEDENVYIEDNDIQNDDFNEETESAGSETTGGAFGGSKDYSKLNNNIPKQNVPRKKNQAHNLGKNLNNLAGKSEKVPDALKKRNNKMPSTGVKSVSEEKKVETSGKGGGIATGISKGQEAEKEKSSVNQATEAVAEKSGSAALQAAGVPKPLADVAAKKFAGPMAKLAKNKIKLYLIGGVAAFFMWLIIIVVAISIVIMPIVKGLEFINDLKTGVTEFFSSLGHWISGDGWCPTEGECLALAEKEFYAKVDDVSNDYPNIDMPLVLSSVLYGINTNDTFGDQTKMTESEENAIKSSSASDEEKKELYQDAESRIKKVAKKLNEGKSEYEDYMLNTLIPKHYKDYITSGTSAQQILNEIYMLTELFNDFKNKTTIASSGGVCSYSVNGVSVSNIKVRLLNCAWDSSQDSSPIEGEELVDFEKYILGVVYAEHAGAPAEALKTQAIAARSFSLVRPNNMGGSFNLKLEQENGQWVLQLRNCTADHVYCDPDKGCWSDSSTAGDTVHSGYVEGKAWSKPALAADSEIRSAVSAVKGMVLVDGTGKIIQTSYTNTEQQNWSSWANAGSDYSEILVKQYGNGNTILSNCSASLTGDWATWRQYDPRWASVPLGNETLGNVGCLVTSFAIQIARSGTAITMPAGVGEFNPGTFVQYSGISFTTGGAYTGGEQWTNSMAPGFVSAGSLSISGTKQEKVAQVAEYVNQGYYLVPQVKYNGGTHFVAIVGTSGDDIIMADPASDSTELFAKYPSGANSSVTLTGSMFKRTD